MDVDELERKDRKGNYKGHFLLNFDAIDKIESTSSECSSYIGYTIFAIIFIITVFIIILFIKKIINKYLKFIY